MKEISFGIFLTLVSWNAVACIIDPVTLAAENYKLNFKNADLVFFGKIASFDDLKDFEQTVTFVIHKIYKDPEYKTVTIVNKLNTSCSVVFKNNGSNYYVFANFNKTNGNYIIKDGTSFFPQDGAKKYNVDMDKTDNN